MAYINESQRLARTYAKASLCIKTAGKCLYLFTIGVLRRENRVLIGELWELLEHRAPPLEISSLVPAQVCVRLHEQAYDWSTTRLVELFVIAELLQAQQPAACFEFGTFHGRTTLNMAANTPEQTVIYTLDLPRAQMNRTAFKPDPFQRRMADKAMSGTRYRGTGWEHKIQQLYGDSATFDYAPYQGKMDFVFIDGAHTYEYVLNDSRKAIDLLRGGKGIILWHDYADWFFVRKAINYLRTTDPRFANTRSLPGTSFACLMCE